MHSNTLTRTHSHTNKFRSVFTQFNIYVNVDTIIIIIIIVKRFAYKTGWITVLFLFWIELI